MKRYYEIRKVDEVERMVFGYCSTESVDAQGEVVTKAAMENAWADYMQFGNIREMHQASAVGVVKEYNFDDTGVMIGAHVVDDAAWAKVQTGVYKGFSIGGKKLPGGYDAINKTITGLKITEISLVDRPANPDALITMFKADGMEDNGMNEELIKALGLDPATATPEECIAKAAALAAAVAAIPPTMPDITTELQHQSKEPSELRKSVKALAYTSQDDIQKGLYSVGRFAELLESLGWLQTSCAYEAESEKDGSPVPGQIAAAIAPLAAALVAMVQEEASEFMATLKMSDDMDPITLLSNVVSNCAAVSDLKKYQDVMDVFKAGARNSKADADKLQQAHDMLSELGAACKGASDGQSSDSDSGTQKVAKGFVETDVQKALDTALTDLTDIRKLHSELSTKFDDLQKRFDAAPAVPKGFTSAVVIAKGEDGGDLGAALQDVVVEPVTKMDGSIDDVATEIKKLHAGGGRTMFART